MPELRRASARARSDVSRFFARQLRVLATITYGERNPHFENNSCVSPESRFGRKASEAARWIGVMRLDGTLRIRSTSRAVFAEDRKSTRLNSSHLVISYA